MSSLDKTFKFYIKKDANTYYTVSGGQVIETNEKIELRHAPAGWEDIELQYLRNETFFGIFTSIALDHKFVMDAAQILRHVYFTEGWTASPIFYVEKLHTPDFSYRPFYNNRFDFSMAKIQKDYFTAPLLDTDMIGIIHNKKSTTYEIPIEGQDAQTMLIDGITVDNIVSYTPITFLAATTGAVFGICDLNKLNRLTDLGKGLMPDTINSELYSGLGYPGHPFFVAALDQTVQIIIKNMKIQGTYQPKVAIQHWDKDGNVKPAAFSYIIDQPSVPNVINTTIEVEVIKGDRLVFVGGADLTVSQNPPATFQISDESEDNQASFEVRGAIRFTPTFTKAFRYADFARKLIDKLSEGAYIFKSDFLTNTDVSNTFRATNFDNSPYNTMVTCGDALRGINEAKIKTTFNELAKDVWMRWMCGIGLEDGNIIRIEPLSYFLDKNKELFHIDGKHLQSLTISPYNKAQFNNLDIGYDNYSYDELSGKDEFNTGQSYLLTGINIITAKTNDLISAYRADMFGIELLRNWYNPHSTGISDTDTIDNPGDNNTFLIEADPVIPAGSQAYIPYRPAGTITGLTDTESSYNLTLSPKRALLRHMGFIMSMTDKGKLQFQTTDKNHDLQSDFFSGNIIEDADIDLSSITVPPLFQWAVLELEAAPPHNLPELLLTTSSGYISFDYNGNTYKGFILDIGIKPATRDKYTFQLLSHPDNDLTPLINNF